MQERLCFTILANKGLKDYKTGLIMEYMFFLINVVIDGNVVKH